MGTQSQKKLRNKMSEGELHLGLSVIMKEKFILNHVKVIYRELHVTAYQSSCTTDSKDISFPTFICLQCCVRCRLFFISVRQKGFRFQLQFQTPFSFPSVAFMNDLQ